MEHFRIENLSFYYPTSKDKKSLDNVSLKIEKGEYIVLCGKSGSGKTTLLRHLKTVLTPHGKRAGEIFFNGAALNDVDNRKQSSKSDMLCRIPMTRL